MSRLDPSPAPLISCVVPVFNGARYLQEALDSILRQTYQPLEIIVIDDGSTDETPAVVGAYADRVRSLRQPNSGPAAARNRGVREARGELIAFIDADDIWQANKLTRQMAMLQAHPHLGACVTYASNFWIPELRDEEARFRGHRITQPLAGYLASTMLAWRRTFDAVGEFDSTLRFGHSTDWFLRAAARGIVIDILREVLYLRRLHHDNRSRRMNAASGDEYIHLVKRHLDRRRRARAASGGAVGAGKKTDASG